MKDKQLVTIIPPENDGSGVTLTQGTRVILEDGSELKGVHKVELSAGPNDLWRATIHLYPKMGVMKGMAAHIVPAKVTWWRRLLTRLSGVYCIDTTSLSSDEHEYRKP